MSYKHTKRLLLTNYCSCTFIDIAKYNYKYNVPAMYLAHAFSSSSSSPLGMGLSLPELLPSKSKYGAGSGYSGWLSQEATVEPCSGDMEGTGVDYPTHVWAVPSALTVMAPVFLTTRVACGSFVKLWANVYFTYTFIALVTGAYRIGVTLAVENM